MANFSEIQTRVRTRLIDLPAATLAEVPTLVKEAVRDLQSRHNFWVMKKTLAATTEALVRELVPVPANFKEFREEPYYTEDTGFVVPMQFAKSRREVLGMFEVDDDGPPSVILRGEATSDAGASNLEVWPLSDGQSDYSAVPSGEYRVTIPYWGYLTELSANGDTNWFTAHPIGEQFIIARAVAFGFAINWDLAKETEWLGIAESNYAKLVVEDKRLVLSGQDTFVPRQGAWWNRNQGPWTPGR